MAMLKLREYKIANYEPALASDVSILDFILHASYDILSGPAGHPRNRLRYRTLFGDGARPMPLLVLE